MTFTTNAVNDVYDDDGDNNGDDDDDNGSDDDNDRNNSPTDKIPMLCWDFSSSSSSSQTFSWTNGKAQPRNVKHKQQV